MFFKVKIRFNVFIILLLCSQTLLANINNNFKLENGDILFQESKPNSFTKAVQAVTHGYKGAHLSHVALLYFQNNKPYVIEATDKVNIVSLSTFMKRSLDKNGNPLVMVGRLKEQYQHLIPEAIKIGISLKGLPYNDNFKIGNTKAFYCSQLVYYCFKKANNGKSIFKLSPMTFKEPGKSKYFKVWIEYFKKLNMHIPEGELGLNPGGMSRSNVLNIVHEYSSFSNKYRVSY